MNYLINGLKYDSTENTCTKNFMISLIGPLHTTTNYSDIDCPSPGTTTTSTSSSSNTLHPKLNLKSTNNSFKSTLVFKTPLDTNIESDLIRSKFIMLHLTQWRNNNIISRQSQPGATQITSVDGKVDTLSFLDLRNYENFVQDDELNSQPSSYQSGTYKENPIQNLGIKVNIGLLYKRYNSSNALPYSSDGTLNPDPSTCSGNFDLTNYYSIKLDHDNFNLNRNIPSSGAAVGVTTKVLLNETELDGFFEGLNQTSTDTWDEDYEISKKVFINDVFRNENDTNLFLIKKLEGTALVGSNYENNTEALNSLETLVTEVTTTSMFPFMRESFTNVSSIENQTGPNNAGFKSEFATNNTRADRLNRYILYKFSNTRIKKKK